jgi:hypothetical protein
MDPATLNPDDALSLIKAIIDAAGAKNWLLLVPVACLLAVFLIRKFVGPKVPWLQTDRGGALLNLLSAIAAAVISAAVLPGPKTAMSVIIAALTVLLGNQLLFSWAKKLLSPSGADAVVAVDAKVATVAAVTDPTVAASAINGAMDVLKK